MARQNPADETPDSSLRADLVGGGGRSLMGTAISVVVHPHWLNGWLLRLFAVPFIVVDGIEHPAQWNRPLRLEVSPGQRLVGAGIRYRGMQRLLGHRPTTVNVTPEAEVRVLAHNGLLNSEPFSIRVLT